MVDTGIIGGAIAAIQKQPAAGISISHRDAPHSFGSQEGSGSNRFLHPVNFDVAVVVGITEMVLMRFIQKIALIHAGARFRVLWRRGRVNLIHLAAGSAIGRSLASVANTSPNIARALLSAGVFHQQEGSRRITHHGC